MCHGSLDELVASLSPDLLCLKEPQGSSREFKWIYQDYIILIKGCMAHGWNVAMMHRVLALFGGAQVAGNHHGHFRRNNGKTILMGDFNADISRASAHMLHESRYGEMHMQGERRPYHVVEEPHGAVRVLWLMAQGLIWVMTQDEKKPTPTSGKSQALRDYVFATNFDFRAVPEAAR